MPPTVAAALLPGLTVPTEFCAIVNAHYRVDPPTEPAADDRVRQRHAEWLFAFPDRLSVTISGANRLLESRAKSWRARSGSEVARMIGAARRCRRGKSCASGARPLRAHRRAGCNAVPAATTQWRNLVLAGDWTATGLPATIEGAIRSGNRAADLVLPDQVRCTRATEPPQTAAPAHESAVSTTHWTATQALLACQRPDGHWVFELEADATIPAEYVLLKHYLGRAARSRARSARSPSICAASRASMAAGRCSMTAISTSAPA